MTSNPKNTGTLPATHPILKTIEQAVDERFEQYGGSGGGGGGDTSNLEKRINNLEMDIKSIRETISTTAQDIAIIKSNYVTKADLSDVKTDLSDAVHTQTKWLCGILIAAITIIFAIQRLSPVKPEVPSVQYQPNSVQPSTQSPVVNPTPKQTE